MQSSALRLLWINGPKGFWDVWIWTDGNHWTYYWKLSTFRPCPTNPRRHTCPKSRDSHTIVGLNNRTKTNEFKMFPFLIICFPPLSHAPESGLYWCCIVSFLSNHCFSELFIKCSFVKKYRNKNLITLVHFFKIHLRPSYTLC